MAELFELIIKIILVVHKHKKVKKSMMEASMKNGYPFKISKLNGTVEPVMVSSEDSSQTIATNSNELPYRGLFSTSKQKIDIMVD